MAWYGIKIYLVCIDCNDAGTKNVAKEMKRSVLGLLKLEIRRGLHNFQTRVCAVLSFFFFSQRTPVIV